MTRVTGKQRADAQFAGNYHPIPASKLLEVVLIDSTVLDTWCVLDDESVLPLGRPTLTIAIDLFTRMILAVIITYEPPSLYTAMACLKRVNMSKEDINERWPTIVRSSDGWGKPTTVVVDNELAQAGKSYQSACEDAKINVKWAPVARPQYKAVVERFFLTLKKMLLDKLPGGLPYKPEVMRQLGIDPAEIATITLSKLTELVNMTINDLYHYAPHSTIEMPPALAWEKSKRKHKRPYIGDIDFLDKAFGALETGTLTTSGIKFENMEFHDTEITGALMDDLGGLAPRRKRRKSLLSSLNPKVAQRGHVDVAGGFAAGAFDLEPAIAAVDRLVDRRRRVDRFAIRPHAFIPAFAQQLVRRSDQRLPLGSRLRRLRGQDRGHGTGAAELFGEGLAVAPREGCRVVLRRHRRRLIELRPAAVFLVAPGPVGAGVVQQALAYVSPDRVLTVQADGVDFLNLDGPAAAPAADPQQVFGNLAERLQASGRARPGAATVGTGILQERAPVFRRQVIAGSQSRRHRCVPADGGSRDHPFHLYPGRHAPSGGAVGHALVRTYQEHWSRVRFRRGQPSTEDPSPAQQNLAVYCSRHAIARLLQPWLA